MKTRDKRALIAAGIAVALFVIFQFGVFPAWDRMQGSRMNLEVQERTLAKYREAAASLEWRNQQAAALETQLREAEGGLLESGTAALASAEMQGLVRNLAAAQSIEVRSSDFLPVRPLGENYAQVPVGLQFQCRLDQLAGFLQSVGESTRSLSVSRLLLQAANPKEGTVGVNLILTGIMRAGTAAQESSR